MMPDAKPRYMSPEEQGYLNNHLVDVARQGDTEAVKVVLAAGADVHADDDFALCLAGNYGHTETVRLLLASGAHARAREDYPLRWAAHDGHTELVKLLLASGSDVHAKDDAALRWAACLGHTETVQVLTEYIFAPESWRGKSRAEIEAGASALYDKIKAYIPSNLIKPEDLHRAAALLADAAIDCWHEVRPPPPPEFKITPLPAQPTPV